MQNIIDFNWSECAAEISLAAFAIVAILISAFFASRRGEGFARFFAAVGVLVSMCVEIARIKFGWGASDSSVGIFRFVFMDGAFSFFAMLCTLLSIAMIEKNERAKGEFSAIMMLCCAGLMIFVRSQNLLVAFVALEAATICLYVLTAWHRDNAPSLEAAVRYLIAGGAGGAILLLGLAFLYGAGFPCGANLLDIANFGAGAVSPLFWTAIAFVCVGVYFKIAAFPFQFWAPDVYQGAPTPVSAFLAVLSKGAGVVFLTQIFAALSLGACGDANIRARLVLISSVVAGLTILVGNLGGITQTNAKRLLAFSGISNAGYLLVLATCALLLGNGIMLVFAAIYFYLTAYMFANYGIFLSVSAFEGEGQTDLSLSDYRGMSARSPITAGALAINLGSLAGIPPTAGFFGKILIILAAWWAQLYILTGVMIFGSVVSIYYYFSWIRAAFAEAEGAPRDYRLSEMRSTTMAALAVCTLLFGFVLFGFTSL